MEINFILVIGVGLATLFVGYFVGMFERRGGDKEPRAQPPPAASRPGGPENSLLRLSLDGNNQLQLDVDGQRAEASGLNPEQRKRVIDLMVMIRPWVDASAPRPPAPAPSRPVTAPVPRPAEKAAAPGPAASGKKDEPEAPTTMVAQIDAILQAHLADSLLASRGIRLVESPEGGVVVMVGLSKYSGVGDVPDPQVQAMIRTAITEWEKKYTPGG